ncbi:MAG: cytochrome c [Planctomycetota bacterium]
MAGRGLWRVSGLVALLVMGGGALGVGGVGCGESEWPDPFAVPMTEQQVAAKVALGKSIFAAQSCNACHSVTGGKGTGPALNGLFGTEVELIDGKTAIADYRYLRRSIRNPIADVKRGYSAGMASYAHLSNAEVDALVFYLRDIGPKVEAEGSESGSTGEGGGAGEAGVATQPSR